MGKSGNDHGVGDRRTCVIYARVSSKQQEEEGFSIPAQLELLRSYAGGEWHHCVEGVHGRGNGQAGGPHRVSAR